MNLSNGSIGKLIIHYVGSKNNLEPVHLSQHMPELDSEVLQIIQENFLNRFRNAPEFYQFHHPSSLQFNEVYNFSKLLFEQSSAFQEVSVSFAKHLYECAEHPKVKGGELYICFFDALPVEGSNYRAIGLFKTENKSLFLNTTRDGNQFNLALHEGVEPSRMDKGCLIINQNEDEGYRVMIFDNQNRGEEAQYWREKFLGLVPAKDEFHQTKHFLTLTRQFITDQLETEQKVSRTDQIELLTKSLDYFKSRDAFDIEEFQKEVFREDEMIESFRSFGSRYTSNNEFDIAASFEISPDAVKKQARIYRNVIKLDKNFHIYVHGRTDLIEKGVDMDGRKYYKIYYQDES